MKRSVLFLFAMFVGTFANAETQTTKWYINGELYDTTTCESGGDINVPNTPELFGHTFQGWMPAIYDMSTLNSSENGLSYTLSGKNWRAVFSYGTVYGTSLCSPTSSAGSWYTNEDIDTTTGEGRYCWCRITEFIPTGSDMIYEPVSSYWGFYADRESASSCASSCPNSCGIYFQRNSSFRSNLLR